MPKQPPQETTFTDLLAYVFSDDPARQLEPVKTKIEVKKQ